MVQSFTPRQRKVRILATLGPASANAEMIAALHRAGADAFRVNMSHGDHEGHAKVIAAIRALEKETGRPTTILVDLQGPKLRVGTFRDGPAELATGATFVLDTDKAPGDATRVHLPHPELFAALEPETRLLVDDGKLVLRVKSVATDRIETLVEVGDRRGEGVNLLLGLHYLNLQLGVGQQCQRVLTEFCTKLDQATLLAALPG